MKKALGEAQEKIAKLDNQLRDCSPEDPGPHGTDDDDLYAISDEDRNGEDGESNDEDISLF